MDISEEQDSDLDDRVNEFSHSREKKKKEVKKNNDSKVKAQGKWIRKF